MTGQFRGVLRAAQLLIASTATAVIAFGHGLSKTISLELEWVAVDALNGVYVSNIEVGTPPQFMTVVYDPTSSDIFLHNTRDKLYLQSCSEQTPNSICYSEFDNNASSTFHIVGRNDFDFQFLGLATNGSYATDTVRVGKGTVVSQVIASVNSGSLPFHVLGLGFASIQGGVMAGTFPQYPTLLERLQCEGEIASQTQSMWLNPDLGPDNSPANFPNGSVLFGKLDRSLFDGPLVTLPVTGPMQPNVDKNPLNWNVAVSSITKGPSSSNLVASPGGISCILDAGTGFSFAPPNTTFNQIVKAFPSAVLNSSLELPFWQIDCAERENPANEMKFTFVDPRDPTVKQTITVPPNEVIWPTRNVVPGGSSDTCALSGYSWQTYFGDVGVGATYDCVLGVGLLKNAYVVLDAGNRQVSLARANYKRGTKRDLVVIPRGGVEQI